MNMKRIAALALSALMAASVLTACGSSAPEAENDGTTTLKLSTWDYSSMPALQNTVKAFEESHPNIKVEVIDIPAADYTTKLTTMLNGGSELDVMIVKDADTTKSLANKKQLLALDDKIAASNVDLSVYNGLAENFNFDGKQYCLPLRADYYVMFYNKDIFDAHNMAYPTNDWTWADFEQMAMDLADPANNQFGAYIHTWQACVQNWGIQDGEHTIMDYETGYDFFKPYYEMILRLQEAKAIHDYGVVKGAKINYAGAFTQGNVAMMPMGSWFIATMLDKVKNGETDINWGIATLPHPENVEAGYVVGTTTPMAVNAASKHPEEAWELLNFFTGEEGAAQCAAAGQFPGRADQAAIEKIASAEGMPEGSVEALQVKHIALDRPVMDKVAEVNQMLGEQHSMIMLKQDTLDNVLAEMAKQAKEIVEE